MDNVHRIDSPLAHNHLAICERIVENFNEKSTVIVHYTYLEITDK